MPQQKCFTCGRMCRATLNMCPTCDPPGRVSPLSVPCPRCHAPAGSKCRNYLGQNKFTCKQRLQTPALVRAPKPEPPVQPLLFTEGGPDA